MPANVRGLSMTHPRDNDIAKLRERGSIAKNVRGSVAMRRREA
jgi:hypothetical protein